MEDFKKFSMYNENEETTASGGVTEGSTRVEKDLRLLVNRICSRAYLDSNEEIGKWIQAYADAEKSACLAALKELILIAEDSVKLGYLNVIPEHYPKEYAEAVRMKSAIERAKKLAL